MLPIYCTELLLFFNTVPGRIHAAVHLGMSLNDSLRNKSAPIICNLSWTAISTPSLLCIRPQPTWCFSAPNKRSVACHPHYKRPVLLKYKMRGYL